MTSLLHRSANKVRAKLRTTRRKLKRPNAGTPRRLHLGCGHIPIPGFCNVDAMTLPAVDIIDNIMFLSKFPQDFADQIYACHVLEHIAHEEVIPTLQRWRSILRPGGELRISVPDIDRIVKIYSKNWEHFQTPGNSPWIGLLYGGQGDRYDFHKTGFNFCWMSHLLEKAGFVEISEYPHFPHFLGNVFDASLAKEPFGEYLSLNIACKKPLRP